MSYQYIFSMSVSLYATFNQHHEISKKIIESALPTSGDKIVTLAQGESLTILLSNQSLQLNLSGNATISIIQYYNHLYRIPYLTELPNVGVTWTRREIWKPFVNIARSLYGLRGKKLYSYAPATLVEDKKEELKEYVISWQDTKEFLWLHNDIITYLEYGDGCDWCEGEGIYLSKLFYRLHSLVSHTKYHQTIKRLSQPYQVTDFNGTVVPLWWFGYGNYIGTDNSVVIIQASTGWVEWIYEIKLIDPISSQEKRELLEFIYAQ